MQPRMGWSLDRDHSESLETAMLRAHVAMISEVSLRIAESSDLDSVLQEVVGAARSLGGASSGAVVVFDDSGQIRDLITSGMTPERETD